VSLYFIIYSREIPMKIHKILTGVMLYVDSHHVFQVRDWSRTSFRAILPHWKWESKGVGWRLALLQQLTVSHLCSRLSLLRLIVPSSNPSSFPLSFELFQTLLSSLITPPRIVSNDPGAWEAAKVSSRWPFRVRNAGEFSVWEEGCGIVCAHSLSLSQPLPPQRKPNLPLPSP
jgi:hypothetical protein